ncbi:MAG: diguanylate cyclase, partial [Clostridiales bacterium]|nr:diguanylate cyclase [Clostridiales bacterium]
MISAFLSRLKFRKKLRFSFVALIILMAINAAVAGIAIMSITSQMEYLRKIEQIIKAVNQTNISVHTFAHAASREDANQVYTCLESIRQQLQRIKGRFKTERSRADINSQLDNLKGNFQKFVIIKDQAAVLESRSLYLGRKLITKMDETRSRKNSLLGSGELNSIISQVLDIQWQGQEAQFRKTPPSPENLRRIINNLIAYGDQARIKQHNTEAQRAIFFIVRDAKDYVSVFERHIHYQALTAKTEQDLLAISNQIYQSCLTFETRSRQSINRWITAAAIVIALIFAISLVAAKFMSSFLFSQITDPISELVSITRKISEGDRTVRASEGIDDEIGELAHSFNIMTENLQRSEEELVAYSQNLEQRVQERTEELRESNQKLMALSFTDGLTEIANRRYFDKILTNEYARLSRSGAELSLVLLDIDHFKSFNDNYGHIKGDECLRQIGKVLSGCAARPADLAARYGGEEFACILPETDHSG